MDCSGYSTGSGRKFYDSTSQKIVRQFRPTIRGTFCDDAARLSAVADIPGGALVTEFLLDELTNFAERTEDAELLRASDRVNELQDFFA